VEIGRAGDPGDARVKTGAFVQGERAADFA
jgi:hypothetical protein